MRQVCEGNSCGAYDKTWACPPAVGDLATVFIIASYDESGTPNAMNTAWAGEEVGGAWGACMKPM